MSAADSLSAPSAADQTTQGSTVMRKAEHEKPKAKKRVIKGTKRIRESPAPRGPSPFSPVFSASTDLSLGGCPKARSTKNRGAKLLPPLTWDTYDRHGRMDAPAVPYAPSGTPGCGSSNRSAVGADLNRLLGHPNYSPLANAPDQRALARSTGLSAPRQQIHLTYSPKSRWICVHGGLAQYSGRAVAVTSILDPCPRS